MQIEFASKIALHDEWLQYLLFSVLIAIVIFLVFYFGTKSNEQPLKIGTVCFASMVMLVLMSGASYYWVFNRGFAAINLLPNEIEISHLGYFGKTEHLLPKQISNISVIPEFEKSIRGLPIAYIGCNIKVRTDMNKVFTSQLQKSPIGNCNMIRSKILDVLKK